MCPASTSTAPGQVGHRARHLRHPVQAARRPAQPVGHLLEQRARRLGQAQARLDLRRAEQGVGHALARQLALARVAHARGDGRPTTPAPARRRPAARAADGSSSAGRSAGTSICMSMRSSSGPDSRAW